MNTVSRDLLVSLQERVRDSISVPLARIVVFGSVAAGTAGPASDLDLLVVVAPTDPRWQPSDNIRERKRIERDVSAHDGHKLDVWVRTAQQCEDGRSVIGGVEQLADVTGVSLIYSNQRPTTARRSRQEMRYMYVYDWLEEARRLLSYSAHGAPDSRRSVTAQRVAHFSWRSIQRSLGATFVWRQVSPPAKDDAPCDWLAALSLQNGLLAEHVGGAVLRADIAPADAAAVLSHVIDYLGFDPRLAPRLRNMKESLMVSPGRMRLEYGLKE